MTYEVGRVISQIEGCRLSYKYDKILNNQTRIWPKRAEEGASRVARARVSSEPSPGYRRSPPTRRGVDPNPKPDGGAKGRPSTPRRVNKI